MRRRVAVIGSGVAGLTAAHLLQRRYDVTLIEADDRLGGHAHTHEHISLDAGLVRVDSGFIVHNRVTYPNLVRLFDELRVSTRPTGMSMSVRCDGCGLEYAGALGPGGLFAQPRSLARPPFLRMLYEITRFHREARGVLDAHDSADDETTLAGFLMRGGYSRYFVSHYMVPVVSAVWSAGPETALQYPARYLFAFLANHGMLSVRGSHQWYTVVGGSRTYVEAVAKNLTEVRTSTPVRSVARRADRTGVEVTTEDGITELFAGAVVATHPDTALGILARPTGQERAALGAFRYSRNETVLHQDTAVLPRAGRARAAWNYLLPDCAASHGDVLVSYDMNRLQHIPGGSPYLVTLNATERIRPDRVIARMVYEHPIYTPESVSAQRLLPALNDDLVAFAGAYHGWGFHEDGCRAGVAAAESLGAGW
ncbi:MAG TPA: FAD-dependent oxidoreductase [Acidimicrobiales bacterium]|nr:FAD-dependent oxidoreductase [Acidimicrobiales bacterium]